MPSTLRGRFSSTEHARFFPLQMHLSMSIYSFMSDAGKLPVARLEALIACLRRIEIDLSLPLLVTLAAIARYPGLSINELADRIDVPQQTASRYVGILQGRYHMLGQSSTFANAPLLTTQVSVDDPRRRALFLTKVGQARLSSILQELYGRADTE